MSGDDEEDGGGLDLDQRELCADGSCTGVIGDDGLCRVCRLAGDGAAGSIARTPGAAPSRSHDADDGEDAGEAERGAEDELAAGPALDEDRELCPDGSCVGLIGEDRRCKVCGRAAE